MNRTMLILSGALLVAGIALFYVYSATFMRDETGGQRMHVIAAAVDIPFGQPIRAEWLTTKEIPESYVEERHIMASDLRSLIGVVLAQSVRSGEAILRTDLSSLSDQQRTLSGEIPAGRRAISVRARPESSFAGLLRPGDRVDMLVTVGDYRVENSGRCVVVAQNLLVLAVGRELEITYDNDREQPRGDWTTQLSLEVTPDVAQRIAVADEQGDMRVLLRNPNDASRVEDPPEIDENALVNFDLRQDWLRRFALAQRVQ
jgi:pilus assembly protein CpaB